jgi:hypothetical protein
MSDTHGCHRQIEERFGLIPEDTDLLLHTGDMTNSGHDNELADFNQWLGELKLRMPNMVVLCITGNHEFKACLAAIGSGSQMINLESLLNQSYFQQRIPNAKVLSHCETVTVCGLTIHGASWAPWWSDANPGGKPILSGARLDVKAHIYQSLMVMRAPRCVHIEQPVDQVGHLQHYFEQIPVGVDVLMVHCPPWQLLDALEGSLSSWGSSQALLRQLYVSTPKCVCFGHVHENRGFWQRVAVPSSAAAAVPAATTAENVRKAPAVASSASKTFEFRGGTEYLVNGTPMPTRSPPSNLPVQVISNAALMNHGSMDRAPSQITGRPRRIIGTRTNGEWSFVVEQQQPFFCNPVPHRPQNQASRRE